MGSVKGITIELGFNNKSKLKLKAIAKHAGTLADELDEIDKAIECPHCGSFEVSTYMIDNDKLYQRKCDKCNQLVE